MNTYIWKISSLDCVSDGESKVVYCIHWRIKGDDAVNAVEAYGKQSIEKSTDNTFIAYEDLPEAEVITFSHPNPLSQISSLYSLRWPNLSQEPQLFDPS